jgi:hypothetical protein
VDETEVTAASSSTPVRSSVNVAPVMSATPVLLTVTVYASGPPGTAVGADGALLIRHSVTGVAVVQTTQTPPMSVTAAAAATMPKPCAAAGPTAAPAAGPAPPAPATGPAAPPTGPLAAWVVATVVTVSGMTLVSTWSPLSGVLTVAT